MFRKCHCYGFLVKLEQFKNCKIGIFNSPMELVCHLQSDKDDYYHRIVMHIIQNYYSSLLSKFTIALDQVSKNAFYEKKKDISLPSHLKTDSIYSTFDVIK